MGHFHPPLVSYYTFWKTFPWQTIKPFDYQKMSFRMLSDLIYAGHFRSSKAARSSAGSRVAFSINLFFNFISVCSSLGIYAKYAYITTK